MIEWTTSEEREPVARVEYEHIMTTPSPDPTGVYIESGVIDYVSGEMSRRDVLTRHDCRLIKALVRRRRRCDHPIEIHVWAAPNSGDPHPRGVRRVRPPLRDPAGLTRCRSCKSTGCWSSSGFVEQRGIDLAPRLRALGEAD